MSVRYSRQDHVARISLHRPPRNTIDNEWLAAFAAALDAAEGDESVTSVVVRSTQPRYFCGGADVGQLRGSSTAENLEFVRSVQATFNRLEALPCLTIAVLAGHATGGGYELALACDVRLAVTGEYRIGLPEATLGLLPAGGGTQRLHRLVGAGRALTLMCTGMVVDPTEATRWGLVDRLLEPEHLDAELDDVTRRLATVPRDALAAIKRCVHGGRDLSAGLETETREIGALFDSEETQRRLAAFLNR